MRVTKIKQAKRRVAIRLLLILVSMFLIGAATGSAAALLAVIKFGLI